MLTLQKKMSQHKPLIIMKTISLTILLILVFFANYSFAQITTRIIVKQNEPQSTETIKYDSTKNWLGSKNIESYIGQTLYVNGKSEGLKEYGYDGFHNQREEGSGKHYGNNAEASPFNTKYEDLFGRYFVVDEVYKDKLYSSFKYWWFLIHEKNNPEIQIWFKYSEEFEHSWPFLVVSCFEYLKKNVIGKKYISEMWERETTDDEKNKYGSKRIITRVNDTDINTGGSITHTLSDIWECIDVTIEEDYFTLSLVVKNQKNQTSLIPADILGQRENGTYWIYEKTVYDKYVTRFGVSNMNKIRQRKIAVGMTIEMLKLSWGEPDNINRSSQGLDQWVYDGQYVYVQNGKITAWN